MTITAIPFTWRKHQPTDWYHRCSVEKHLWVDNNTLFTRDGTTHLFWKQCFSSKRAPPFNNQRTHNLSNPIRLFLHFRFFHICDNITLTDNRAPNFGHHPTSYQSSMITRTYHYMLNTLAVRTYSNHYKTNTLPFVHQCRNPLDLANTRSDCYHTNIPTIIGLFQRKNSSKPRKTEAHLYPNITSRPLHH